MPIQSLMKTCALKIAIDDIERIPLSYRRRINHVLGGSVKRTRYYRNRKLSEFCKCGLNGDCLCYFVAIKSDMVDQHWGDESQITQLGDLCEQ